MVKKNKNKQKNKRNEKYVGLGTSLENSFALQQPHGFVTSNKHETAFCCLLVRRQQGSHPLVGSLVRSGSRCFNDIHNWGQILYEIY